MSSDCRELRESAAADQRRNWGKRRQSGRTQIPQIGRPSQEKTRTFVRAVRVVRGHRVSGATFFRIPREDNDRTQISQIRLGGSARAGRVNRSRRRSMPTPPKQLLRLRRLEAMATERERRERRVYLDSPYDLRPTTYDLLVLSRKRSVAPAEGGPYNRAAELLIPGPCGASRAGQIAQFRMPNFECRISNVEVAARGLAPAVALSLLPQDKYGVAGTPVSPELQF